VAVLLAISGGCKPKESPAVPVQSPAVPVATDKQAEAFRQAVFLQIRTDLEGYKALPPDVLGRSLDFLVAKKESKELVPGASPEDLAFLNQLRTIEGDKAVSAELRTKAARVREAFTLKQ
jgi:hypothetical protein